MFKTLIFLSTLPFITLMVVTNSFLNLFDKKYRATGKDIKEFIKRENELTI